jgi:non-homologous end joining protein Ku
MKERTAMAQRAYAKDIVIDLFGGMTNVIVDLVAAREGDSDEKFTTCCPACPEPTKLSQVRICTKHSPIDRIRALLAQSKATVKTADVQAALDGGHGPYGNNDVDRAKEISKGILARVSDEEYEAVKATDLETKDGLTLQVVDAEEFERHSIPNGNVYRIRPKGQFAIYSMLVDLIGDRSRAWIGEMTLRSKQNLYRISVWNGQLLLQEHVRPSDLAPADEIEQAEYPGGLLDRANEMADQIKTEFDAAAFANQVKERGRQLAAAKAAGGEGSAVEAIAAKNTAPKADAADSLMAMLESSLASAKPAKKKAS